MIVWSVTYQAKIGRTGELAELLKSIKSKLLDPSARRIYVSSPVGAPVYSVVAELEFENVAALEQYLKEWFAKPENAKVFQTTRSVSRSRCFIGRWTVSTPTFRGAPRLRLELGRTVPRVDYDRLTSERLGEPSSPTRWARRCERGWRRRGEERRATRGSLRCLPSIAGTAMDQAGGMQAKYTPHPCGRRGMAGLGGGMLPS